MTIPVNGENLSPPEAFIYWINERYQIFLDKEAGKPKPWSTNRVFQTTYFCNVHRENDKVTKWIREHYSGLVDDPMFEYNIILSRFLNWPATLDAIGYQWTHRPDLLLTALEELAGLGKIWGGAYIITTHGIPMPKATYLCKNVLEDVYKGLEGLRKACRSGSCGVASRALQGIEGIGSFLAGQIVADLKNTVGYPHFDDWYSFVEPGPGSTRGLGWFFYQDSKAISVHKFHLYFNEVRKYVDLNWPGDRIPPIHNQDLQNCLCEFDKFCRVSTGSGRSKRVYNGTP